MKPVSLTDCHVRALYRHTASLQSTAINKIGNVFSTKHFWCVHMTIATDHYWQPLQQTRLLVMSIHTVSRTDQW